jgi:dipeptidase D
MDFSKLSPTPVWCHFQTLCEIPRASKCETQLRQNLQAWAQARGLETMTDSIGSLLIRKPGSAGREHYPGVILQGHLDMVCQKNSGSSHDFSNDAIDPVQQDGWLVAPNTTLGADNGIGVALALAILEAEDLAHPPLEVLLTVDEEAGMGGARGLAPDLLQGRFLVNLDTEEWGQLYVGCAGSVDVNVAYATASEPLPTGWSTARLTLGGLTGGHSGLDIHLGRGNAIKLLVRALLELPAGSDSGWRLIELAGGSARNALPREAWASIAVAQARSGEIEAAIAQTAAAMAREFAGIESGLTLQFAGTSAPAATAISAQHQATLLAALEAAPHGVKAMSSKVPGVVETSNSFGVLTMADGVAQANFMVRSLVDSCALAHARDIADGFTRIGAESRVGEGYPGWKPNPDSPLLTLARRAYAREFGDEAAVQVIHAGLECGIIGAKYPGLDMISFGPTIRGAHAPGERVEISSVAKSWQLLTALLADLPAA